MDTLQELETVLDRLDDCPRNLAKTELQTFRQLIDNDPSVSAMIARLIQTYESDLGSIPLNLVEKYDSSTHKSLDFATTPGSRAALGYRVCTTLLAQPYAKNADFGNAIVKMGGGYVSQKRVMFDKDSQPAIAVAAFSQVFLKPVVAYLRGAMGLNERILFLLSRYKQRTEWFPDRVKIQELIGQANEKKHMQLEGEIVLDFMRYLFDDGITFSVEAQAPPDRGRVDILAYLPDGSIIPIEAKVYDGHGRDRAYISDGIAQTAAYARKFGQRDAYLLVYNVAVNQLLTMPGDATGGTIIQVNLGNERVHSVVVDRCITVSASDAKRLPVDVVPLPKQTDPTG